MALPRAIWTLLVGDGRHGTNSRLRSLLAGNRLIDLTLTISGGHLSPEKINTSFIIGLVLHDSAYVEE